MIKEEYILCAAIYFDDDKQYYHQPKNIETGYVICGRRHHNCFMTLDITSHKDYDKLNFEKTQGFVTNTDRFVGREEGLIIARNANQILDEEQIRGNRLFSEDLY